MSFVVFVVKYLRSINDLLPDNNHKEHKTHKELTKKAFSCHTEDTEAMHRDRWKT